MIQKIVFATDLGPFSSLTLEHVFDLAEHYGARIYVVHAIEALSGLARAVMDGAGSSAEIEALIQSIRTRILESLADEVVGADDSLARIADVIVAQGRPAEVVLQQTQRVGGDLVVLGSHGPDSMGANMLGAVTTRVLQLSKVPVYMVPMLTPQAVSADVGRSSSRI